MASKKVFLLALAALCLTGLGRCDTQPVIVISSSNLQLDHRSGIAVSTDQLAAELPVDENSHVICTVLVDGLSTSDFSLYGDAYDASSAGGVFSNVKALMASARSSAVVPSVKVGGQGESFADSLSLSLASSQSSLSPVRATVRSADDLVTLKHGSEPGASLWIVALPGIGEPLDRPSYLRRADQLIGLLREKVGTNYTILLAPTPAGEAVRAPSRHLLAAEATATASASEDEPIRVYAFYCSNYTNATNSSSVLLSFREISLTYNRSDLNYTLNMSSSGEPQIQLDGCDDSEPIWNTVTAYVNMSQNGFNATLGFKFYKTNGKLENATSSNVSFYWELRMVFLAGDQTANRPLCYTPPSTNEWVIAPQTFSFSCQPEREWLILQNNTNWRTERDPGALNDTGCVNNNNNNNGSIDVPPVLKMRGLQVQAFSIAPKNGFTMAFGPPIDCVPYFSGVTWMGILVGLFLATIVLMASLIFLSMETPDRFDDPKGKNIQIEK